jgi:RNA polymerase sporulation-specific sigma factor
MLPSQEEQLIRAVANRDDEAFAKLFKKYYPIVRKFRHQYYIEGYDFEDLDQEAGIVLYRSACWFKPARKVSFGSFSSLNLRNRLFDLIRSNNAQKRLPSEPLTSIEANERLYEATVADYTASSPETAAIIDEELRKLYSKCSPLEKRAFHLMMNDQEFSKLDAEIRRAIINAFERCRRKFDDEIN